MKALQLIPFITAFQLSLEVVCGRCASKFSSRAFGDYVQREKEGRKESRERERERARKRRKTGRE